jgi:hypothetical protein
MLDVNTDKLLVLKTENDKWQTRSLVRGGNYRDQTTFGQKVISGHISDNNFRTESNIWSQVLEWARYLDILTDRPSVVTWLRLGVIVLTSVTNTWRFSRAVWFLCNHPVCQCQFLATYQEVRIQFSALADFLRSNGSGTFSLVYTIEELLER